ncbi:MAG: hemolysin family protein [Candidatus Caenarcaniphilales bacterium]|nr:hemolysin family protein [Candidatus Caenarcaniphilales bacterium]
MKDLGLDLFFMVLAIFSNAIYVAAEFSVARIRPSRIDTMAASGDFFQKMLQRAVHRLNDYISAAQVGITIASLVLGYFAENFFSRMLEPIFIGIGIPEGLLHPISFVMAMLMATSLHVVVGEFVPKTLAIQYPERVGVITILFLDFSYRVTKPLVWLLTCTSNWVLSLFGIKVVNKAMLSYSEEEIRYMIEQSQRDGVINVSEGEMVNNVFEFNDTVVREVMTPRTEIIGVAESTTISQASQLASQRKVSKLPIYRENFDNVLGMLHVVDLLDALNQGRGDQMALEIARPIVRVPESKPLSDLLSEFKANREKIAVVMDEFGGTSGLVTLEDIIEEIVGDIKDEDEEIQESIQVISDFEYMVEAAVPISEVNEKLGTSFESEHFDTFGGYVLGLIGREAKLGDEVHSDAWSFIVERMDRRIELIRLIKHENFDQSSPPIDDHLEKEMLTKPIVISPSSQ